MKKILIKTEYITLGQFLKYVNIIDSGAMAKDYLLNNKVYVNSEEENRRGRKLYDGYQIIVGKEHFVIGKDI